MLTGWLKPLTTQGWSTIGLLIPSTCSFSCATCPNTCRPPPAPSAVPNLIFLSCGINVNPATLKNSSLIMSLGVVFPVSTRISVKMSTLGTFPRMYEQAPDFLLFREQTTDKIDWKIDLTGLDWGGGSSSSSLSLSATNPPGLSVTRL